MDSNMYPASVGAIVLTPILAELLMPIAVAVSSGETMPDAKVCLMGIVNRTTILFNIISATAIGYQFDNAKSTVTPAEISLVATMVCIEPYLSTTRGVTRYVKMLRNLAKA